MNEAIVAYMAYHPVRTQRGLEIVSGAIPWLIIIFLFAGSYFLPHVVAYAILAFNVYWLYRSVQLAINATVGYLNVRATEKTDWMAKLRSDTKTKGEYRGIHQVVIIPNVKEPQTTIERNLKSILVSNFPTKNMTVVLAMEERARDFDKEKAALLARRYRKQFGNLLVTWHPLVIGETIGKHSNNTYAARQVKNFLVDKKRLDIKKILVTTSDADTVFPSQYFSLLTYKFLTASNRFRQFFQAPLFMYNNLSRIPFLVRIPAIVGGIHLLSTLTKASGRFMNYSTYSTSLSMLDEVDYWDVDVIPEDWHLNLKCYFKFGGNIGTIPLFLPVYLDAAESTTRWKTYKNSYEQVKRWAWGVVDVPYVIKKFFQHPEISFWDRFVKISLTMEWHFTWSTAWFLITIGALIPTFVNPAFARTTLGYNLSRASGLILTICLVGVLAITVIDILLNPHRKHKFLAFLHPVTYLQWLFLPVVGLLFGSLPGLESQTRLMLGKYIEYRVTEKV
ncbi:glycosyltransferase family 2 protein [Candidatus Microgenomates bacterium]|nr:glycosyltransferase family 2 protein [Candidatus Microgenomates bacterium]